MKTELDSLISVEDWECEDVWTEKAHETKAVDCMLYYVTGFLSMKINKKKLHAALHADPLSASTRTLLLKQH